MATLGAMARSELLGRSSAALASRRRVRDDEPVRLTSDAGICIAPQYLAGRAPARRTASPTCTFVPAMKGPAGAVIDRPRRGRLHRHASPPRSSCLDRCRGAGDGDLAGLHRGCYELFAQRRRSPDIGDLAGRRVGVPALRSSPHLYLSVMAAHVGLDPERDIDWVTEHRRPSRWSSTPRARSTPFWGFHPSRRSLQRTRDRPGACSIRRPSGRGRSIICCMLLGNREYRPGPPGRH
jgi:NitT/TauT family transport system substrate-binding protein